MEAVVDGLEADAIGTGAMEDWEGDWDEELAEEALSRAIRASRICRSSSRLSVSKSMYITHEDDSDLCRFVLLRGIRHGGGEQEKSGQAGPPLPVTPDYIACRMVELQPNIGVPPAYLSYNRTHFL